jgi:hypothetical protein
MERGMAHPDETADLWTYRESGTAGVKPAGLDVVGYSVEAADGDIGKVDEASYEASRSYIVVDTGPWILGKKVILPAGLIEQVDDVAETVHVDRMKDEIENAPEFDESRYRDEDYRSEVGGYYSRGV